MHQCTKQFLTAAAMLLLSTPALPATWIAQGAVITGPSSRIPFSTEADGSHIATWTIGLAPNQFDIYTGSVISLRFALAVDEPPAALMSLVALPLLALRRRRAVKD